MANDDFTVIVNNPVQLPCEAVGVPPPTIHWMKAGVNLTRNDPGVIFLPNGAMRINRVQTADGGVYECIASSIAGVATKALTLVVQGRSCQMLTLSYVYIYVRNPKTVATPVRIYTYTDFTIEI